jgi:hypothetical protein
MGRKPVILSAFPAGIRWSQDDAIGMTSQARNMLQF